MRTVGLTNQTSEAHLYIGICSSNTRILNEAYTIYKFSVAVVEATSIRIVTSQTTCNSTNICLIQTDLWSSDNKIVNSCTSLTEQRCIQVVNLVVLTIEDTVEALDRYPRLCLWVYINISTKNSLVVVFVKLLILHQFCKCEQIVDRVDSENNSAFSAEFDCVELTNLTCYNSTLGAILTCFNLCGHCTLVGNDCEAQSLVCTLWNCNVEIGWSCAILRQYNILCIVVDSCCNILCRS